MKLFKNNQNNLSGLAEKEFQLEKDIQSIIEKNLDKIFGLEFVKSEFSLNNFRIDTVAFNQETHSFFIIEYK